MCHLFGMLANQATRVDCGLVKAQDERMLESRRDASGRTHTDGWGAVAYDAKRAFAFPTCVRHTNAAFGSDRFCAAVSRTPARALVAHVRQATVGFTSTLNAHPFIFDEWTFAHQGTIPHFDEIQPTLESELSDRFLNCRLGTTDSEIFFLWLLGRLEKNNLLCQPGEAEHTAVADALLAAVQQLAEDYLAFQDEPPALNFVMTNGLQLFACRWNESLYWLERTSIPVCDDCGESHCVAAGDLSYQAVLVASEPYSEESWREVPNHAVLCTDRGGSVSLRESKPFAFLQQVAR